MDCFECHLWVLATDNNLLEGLEHTLVKTGSSPTSEVALSHK